MIKNAPGVEVIGTCAMCKYWERIPLNEGFDSGLFGNCGSGKVTDIDDYDDSPTDFIVCSSNYGYGGANLETGQDFGCIHWESKA